ncbi:MAG: NUDIX domain-containing protein [Actinocrinis sp.]
MIEQVSSRVVYQNAWMTVREDDIVRADGSAGIYGVIDKPASALIVPFENDGFWLVEQYRYTVGARCWEFPQGTMPDRADAEPAELARHELAQETGLRAARLRPAGRFYHAYGMSNQLCNMFLATELSRDPDAAAPDPEEIDLVAKWFPRDELEAMLRDGRIVDLATIGAYGLLMLQERAG